MDLKDKLEILAVKDGMKPAFSGVLDQSSPKSYDDLKKAAILLDLNYQVTDKPPPYFSRKPRVKGSFLSVWSRHMVAQMVTFEKVIWVYDDVEVESMISNCIAGRLNEGVLLGYPPCCIKWHEETRTRDVEACFRDNEEYIKDLREKTDEEMYELLFSNTQFNHENFHKHQEKLFMSMEKHIIETHRHYPFVPHWACSSCLSGKTRDTIRMNRQYKQLAMNLNPKFAQEIVNRVSEWITKWERTLNNGNVH